MTLFSRLAKAAALTLATLSLAALSAAQPALAEGRIRLSEQFGTLYLPLHVIRDQNLLEKHAAQQGLDGIEVEWHKISGGNAVNDALLSGSIDVGAAGIGPFLTLWDRTDGGVRIIGGLAHQPNYLITNNPDIRTLRDFSDADKIALPAVGVSVQARILQIAAEKEFGEGRHDALDHLTVGLPHPDATAALLTGSTEVTAHLSNTPFQEQALREEGIHRVFSSFEVLGQPITPTYVYATVEFREQNPKTYAAFLAAFREASAWIEANKAEAVETYIRVENSRLEPEFVLSLLESPESEFTLVPAGSFIFADFLHRIGALKKKADSWKDYTFEDLHDEDGS
ncbi:ABC transporter substrate-binding protein [Paracoccus siganidrum]|uniref:ABC transporter substrate-binding protein n=1 Tax=Paracoccus siganidrum TaxID=1276757 RepID=A0A419AAJ0_9RHOB|nr:ABC transporter substrate-binding protein [Paracoccus siganidrum]RJL19959.1 ABC transporter substrate-binding protein [Paracoccus siganidrum]RMC30551.1 ABC transporter substrate-binding protein [Paracoccus siganidrum]